MILVKGEASLNVHIEEKIKCKTKGEGAIAIVTEPVDKLYIIPFFKRRRLHDNTSVPFGFK